MSVSIGINPITWSNDDLPELGGDISLETCLAETRLAGFSGTELGGKFPRGSTELGPILRSHDLRLVSGWYDGRMADRMSEPGGAAAEFDAALPHLTLLRDLGCKVVVYADTSRRHDGLQKPISQRPVLGAEEWPGYCRALTELADRMAAFGVGMAYHHHMGTIIESDDDIGLLMRHTGPAVGLLYDTGHCLFSGGDPAALLRAHLARVVHVHCKDARRDVLDRARATDMSFLGAVLDGIFTVPGDGCIDFAPLLKTLADHGYAGWLVVEAEQDPRTAHPLTYATMGFRNLFALAQSAGFTVVS